MEAINLEGIKYAEDRLEDQNVLDALKLYNDFEEKLSLYNVISGKSNIDMSQTKDPAKYVKDFLRKKGLKDKGETKQYINELKEFVAQIQKAEKENPYMDFKDITCRKNRTEIGKVISELNPEYKDFVPGNLDAVAVIKCYKLYDAINKIQNDRGAEQNTERILADNGITQDMYQKSKRKIQTYENLKRREVYDRIRKNKSEDIVHIVAATLEISPSEAEKDLAMFNPIYSKNIRQNEFEQSLQVNPDYVEYKLSYDQVNRWESYIDTIMYDENITENEKNLLIQEYKDKVERVFNTIEENKNRNAEKKYIKEGKVGSFIAKGGDLSKLSDTTLQRNGIQSNGDAPQNDAPER